MRWRHLGNVCLALHVYGSYSHDLGVQWEPHANGLSAHGCLGVQRAQEGLPLRVAYLLECAFCRAQVLVERCQVRVRAQMPCRACGPHQKT